MNKNTVNDTTSEEEVVVIEQRDKRARLYIAIAAVLGLAAGGLVGSALTEQQWQSKFEQLNEQYSQLAVQSQSLQANSDERVIQAQEQHRLKLRKALEESASEYELKLNELQAHNDKLKGNIEALEGKIASQKETIASEENRNTQLVRKTDIQASLFEQSQELFKRETELKAQVATLEQEKSQLSQDQKRLKRDCDLFLEGTSWDAKSDSCDRYDAASSRLSQIDQLLQVHNTDLNHIKTLKSELGIQ